jgi:hypothetical protein
MSDNEKPVLSPFNDKCKKCGGPLTPDGWCQNTKCSEYPKPGK